MKFQRHKGADLCGKKEKGLETKYNKRDKKHN